MRRSGSFTSWPRYGAYALGATGVSRRPLATWSWMRSMRSSFRGAPAAAAERTATAPPAATALNNLRRVIGSPVVHVHPHRLSHQLGDVLHLRVDVVPVAHPGDVHRTARVVTDRRLGTRRGDALDL